MNYGDIITVEGETYEVCRANGNSCDLCEFADRTCPDNEELDCFDLKNGYFKLIDSCTR